MPQSLARVWLHIIFSTKHREPLILPQLQEQMNAYTKTVLDTMHCPSAIVNGVPDHIHILCGLSRTVTIADLVEGVKVSTSKWIKTKADRLEYFHWQGGYAAFSVSESMVESVKQYIADQEEHHRRVSFQDELRMFFRKHHVQFDERYVWD